MKLYTTLLFLCAISLYSCKDQPTTSEPVAEEPSETPDASEPFFKISLAQWSLNEPIRNGEMDPFTFAAKAKELGFEGIEYVSQLYTPFLATFEDKEVAMDSLVAKLNRETATHNIEDLIIMIDAEGELAFNDRNQTRDAINNHKRWIDAAEALGCHSIRINLFGEEDPEAWKRNSVRSLKALGAYAAPKGVNVIVENHGGLSSNASVLAEVMTEVNMDNVGTLPDFGNFCLQREGGARWGAPCIEEYDKYKGVEELMPHAKAVSAKSYAFNDAGEETTIDYTRMLQLVKEAGYTGFIGIEYEGSELDPVTGINKTRELLLSAAAQLNE
ncbi:sugar phosphate isomerase/epimerase family protein [Altibacter sp. HG106]|uniref:sugar phosphate isomerase/epimerase family protein n=1 Tax=Altibacter sp. HG106 TaxID=3023937 RepID=UPI002350AA45|nr:sugar phosphate isomerase/epimerase family protein [Altibacter sp. HG106]MDC7994852.1 sugar phosphate isomerase/epimerase [Altibacter sp. HG106]